jgi:predicted lipid-binding transport protein (Tim44 family)
VLRTGTARRPGSAALSAAALVLAASWSRDASAAGTLGGLATSVGMLTALVALLAVKGWSAHAAAGSIGGAGGAALALGAGALLLWRGWRGAIPVRAWVRARLGAGSRQHGAASIFAALQPVPELPPGVDAAALRRDLSERFLSVQGAWDAADFSALAALTTPDMLEELRDHRGEYGGSSACSRIRGLRPAIVGYERRADLEMVCVEFTGTMDEPAGGPQPFRELWMLVRPDHRGGWLLARQQMLL